MNLAGIEPTAIVEPKDAADIAATVARLYAAQQAFAFVGGATSLELGTRLEPCIP